MNDSNFCFFTGVVSGINGVIKTDVIKPVIQMDLFSRDSNEWDSSIMVVFVENEDARKVKGIVEGDIIFVIGKIAYSDEFGYYVYADSFVMLQKNKPSISQLCCRIAYFEFYSYTNTIQISGKICNIEDDKANIIVDRSRNIRGEIVEHDLIPLVIEIGKENLSNGDNIRFLGSMRNNIAYGTAVKIA